MNPYLTGCHAKTRFLNRPAAKRRASQIRRNGGPHFRTYSCRFCGCYHLGSLLGQSRHLRTTRDGQPIHVEDLTP